MSESTDPLISGRRPTHVRRRPYLPLFQRVAATNALLLVAACLVTVVVLSPSKLSAFAADETVVLVAALALVALLNLYQVRRVVSPLQELTELARQVDVTRPGQRMPIPARASEAGELALTLNDMLARLEEERREASRVAVFAQEAERLRIAQELHDQVGQTLTAMLLQLSRIHARVPAEMQPDVDEVLAAARASIEDVRRIAIELRPEALDDLGLPTALEVLADGFSRRSGLRLTGRIQNSLPPISPETELVIHRVAQEALTNVARHAGADHAELTLSVHDGALVLVVSDSGRGMADDQAEGAGIRGMRERASLIGAELRIEHGPSGVGTRVRLAVAGETAP